MVKDAARNPRLLKIYWEIAMEDQEGSPMLKEIYEEAFLDLIPDLHKLEWDEVVIKNLRKIRRQDPYFDFKAACLIYYNDDIDMEEKDRRWDMLDLNQTNQAIDLCNALRESPMQEGWRRKRKSHALFPKEWKHAIRDSWEDKLEALKNLHTWTLERRRKDFEPFYSQERRTWEVQFQGALFDYKVQEANFGSRSIECINASSRQIMHWNQVWQGKNAAELEQIREAAGLRDYELQMKIAHARNAGARGKNWIRSLRRFLLPGTSSRETFSLELMPGIG
jgi:hypothetical protein